MPSDTPTLVGRLRDANVRFASESNEQAAKRRCVTIAEAADRIEDLERQLQNPCKNCGFLPKKTD